MFFRSLFKSYLFSIEMVNYQKRRFSQASEELRIDAKF